MDTWTKDLDRHFYKKAIRIASKYVKKMLNIISH